MNKQECSKLIDELLDGSISDADRLRIEAELIVDAAVRQEYYQRVQLSMLLEQEAAPSSETPAQQRAKPATRLSWFSILAGSAISIAASVLLIVMLNTEATNPDVANDQLAQQLVKPSSTTEPSASGFAVINGQEDAVWSDATFNEGDLLPSGELHLATGFAQIELFSGVQVVLEGESRFRIDSPMQLTMLQGTARAHVPEPAQGFRIKTASGDVVDLGTEFSVNVDETGADVHVIDGEVELHPQLSDTLRLDAGASRRLAGAAGIVHAQSPLASAVGPVDFQDRLQQKQQQRFSQWSQWQSSIKSNSRLVAYYRFHSQQPQSRLIGNIATNKESLAADGTIVAATKAADRWGRSEGAIDFSPVGSRVRVHVDGEYRGLTLLCWVKINSLDRIYNSLFLTDGHEDREPHWQLMYDGRIFFSVKVPRGEGQSEFTQPVYYSPSIWSPSLSGRWTMLAVTYDVDHRKVTHYVNGKAISSESIPDQSVVDAIRIGHASICNWSEPMYRTDPEFILRNLNGTMDEFAILSGALSADEIFQWYEIGNLND